MHVDHPPKRAASACNRRSILVGFAASVLQGCVRAPGPHARYEGSVSRLRQLEEAAGGRLGAHIIDTRSARGFGWRDDERFAHASSFKMSLAAMVLDLADRGEANLSEVLHWAPSDVLPVSPETAAHVAQGLTVEALTRATLVTSDNTAANVLLSRFGGPPRLTQFWRSLHDHVSRLDRYEPELNETPRGTTLDTTTPRAMAATTAALVHGDALTPASRAKLKQWMGDVRTGMQRLRSGFPPDWVSGDKTGTGIGKAKHTYVDIGFGGPPGDAPLVVTAYFEPTSLAEPMDPVSLRVLADTGRIAAASRQTAWTGADAE